jgi:hypothetical protein
MKFDANLFLCYRAHYYKYKNIFYNLLLHTTKKIKHIFVYISELYLSFISII